MFLLPKVSLTPSHVELNAESVEEHTNDASIVLAACQTSFQLEQRH
jgi:hypothetical protein